MHICMLPLKVYVFTEQGHQTSMKTNGTDYPATQIPSIAVSLQFYI